MNTFVSRSATMSHFVFILCGFEYFGINPASDLQTKTFVLHLVNDWLCDLSTSYPQPYTQHTHRVIHSIFCNSELLDRSAVILFGYLPNQRFLRIIVFLVTVKVKTI
jgi:hypothetical protein